MSETPAPPVEAATVPPPPAPEQTAPNADLKTTADNLNTSTLDPDAALKQLAENPDAFGKAPVENPGGPPTEPESDVQTIDAQQARLDEMMNKTPEELQKLAAEGNVLAKRALSDMEKQVAAGAEALNKQVAETGDQSSVVEGQATFTEPSADQRAQGEQVVQAPPPTETPPQAPSTAEGEHPQNPDAAPPQVSTETQTPTTETPTDTEMTPEQKIASEREKAIEMGQELNTMGITPDNPQYESIKKMLAEDPSQMEGLKQGIQAMKAMSESVGVEITATSAQATAEALQKEIEQDEKDGNGKSEMTRRKKILIAALLALLAIPAIAIGGAAVTGGVVAFGLAGAAAKGGRS